jgi:U3 small nucleolar RNA-associated protein 25
MKFFSSSPQEDPDKRFKYFTTKALPSLLRTTSASSSGTLIFVPSYVDYVRIRNYMEQEHQVNKKLGASGFNFSAINEYSSVSDVTRQRALFKDGQNKVILYTERLHHFRRYEIKGAETIFMYGLPDNPTFYVEIVRFLLQSVSDGRANKAAISVKSMFSKWDALKLERIVGSSRVAKMCAGSGEIFEFS